MCETTQDNWFFIGQGYVRVPCRKLLHGLQICVNDSRIRKYYSPKKQKTCVFLLNLFQGLAANTYPTNMSITYVYIFRNKQEKAFLNPSFLWLAVYLKHKKIKTLCMCVKLVLQFWYCHFRTYVIYLYVIFVIFLDI